MHAYNLIVYAMATIEQLLQLFLFYVWATDQAMCPREPIFWHPCSEWQRSPSDGQGELTAILWKLKRKWKLEQPSRVSSVLCLFTLCCYQIYCNFVRLCYVLEGQAAWILIRIINIRRFASLCVSWLFHKTTFVHGKGILSRLGKCSNIAFSPSVGHSWCDLDW